jgi:DNA-binding MarR family transcriptional regulator
MGSGGLRVRLEIARVLRKPSPHATPQRSEIFPVGQTLILRCLVLILSKSPLGHATDFRLLQLISYNKGRQFIMPNNCEPRVSLPSMCTPAQVAARDGTTPQRVTKWVRKLAANGQIEVERDDRGRIARFSVAQFDRHTNGTATLQKFGPSHARCTLRAPTAMKAPRASLRRDAE